MNTEHYLIKLFWIWTELPRHCRQPIYTVHCAISLWHGVCASPAQEERVNMTVEEWAVVTKE
jgi:hypothetical protein